MIDQTPISEFSFLSALDDIKGSSEFAPPENQYLFWQLVSANLEEYYPKDVADWKEWHHKVFDIWTDKKK